MDLNYERYMFQSKIYSHPTNNSDAYSLSIDKIYATSFVNFTKNERLILNILNSIFFWFNFYFFDFLELFSKIISFFRIFKPTKIKKNFLKIKNKFDLFFVSNRVSPIYNLNDFR